MKKITLILFLPAVLSLCSRSLAVSPVSQYFDLVAGSGDPGYQDGTFTSAMFNKPTAAAFSVDGTKIFIVDSGNNRIRMVDLENKNAVSTLTGTGEMGRADGAFKTATFNNPQDIVSLSGNRLLVYDAGNGRFRLLDLDNGQVTTLRGSAGPSLSIMGVTNMAVDASNGSLYLTQTDIGRLIRLDLSTGTVSTVLANDTRIPHPQAICFFQGHLCAADRDLPSVFQVDAGAATVAMIEMARGEKIVAMASSNGLLYAFQAADTPWVRLTASAEFPEGEIKFMSLWAPFLDSTGKEIQTLFNFKDSLPGFIAYGGEFNKFLWVSPQLNQIFVLRDYAFDENKDASKFETIGKNTNGLTDYSYPAAKPPHTFRILMLGDSRISYEKESGGRWPWGFNKQETLPKKLEAMLNFEASLDDIPEHFQVISYARYGWAGSLAIWPNAFGIEPARKFDVDAVIIFMTNDLGLEPWFIKPYTKEGIPDSTVEDKEYMGKPMKEKLANEPLENDFYTRCLNYKWVHEDKWDFEDLAVLSTDPQVRSDLVEMVEKSMGLYQNKLEKLAVEKKHPIPLYVFFAPLGSVGPSWKKVEPYRKLYMDVCRQAGIHTEDLTDALTALKVSAYPISEFWGYYHYDYNGHTLLSYLMAHCLITHQLIPFKPEEITPTPEEKVKPIE